MHSGDIHIINNIIIDNIYVMGDSHGNWRKLVKFIQDNKDFVLIHVGDFGIFNELETHIVADKLEEILSENNGRLLIIRGNHDLPSTWRINSALNREHVTFVPDYSQYIINGKKFLFVGGATSIDRTVRSEGFDYWKGEVFYFDENKIEECDILITHSSGKDEFPIRGLERIEWYLNKDPDLRKELPAERELIQKLYDIAKPKIAHYFGHFHESNIQYVDGVRQRCLNIDEIIDIT